MSKNSNGRAPSRGSRPTKPDPMAGFLSQALIAHQGAQLAEAERLYQYILDKAPQHFDALHYFGALKMQQEDYPAGVALIERALALRNNVPDALSNLAIGLMRLKRNDDALASLDRAIALDPNRPAAHTNRGLVLAALGRHAEAVTAYERTLKLQPTQLEAHLNLANALRALGRFEESIASSNRALALRPVYPEALNNRGLALNAMRRFEEAIASFEQALALRANYAEAHNNRGNALKELQQFDAALAAYDQALSLKPVYAEAQYNRGNTLAAQNRHAEALPEFDKALALQPDHIEAAWNRTLSQLLLGNLRDGLAGYEQRWQLKNADKMRSFDCPRWAGESLQGKRILLWSEQGLGDTLQFSRYASLLAARGAQVLLDVQPALRRLLATLRGVAEVVTNDDIITQADFHCPLLSLPHLMQSALHNIPAQTPYLSADAATLAHWHQRIGTTGLRVAICCSGNPKLANDRNRSIALGQFSALQKRNIQLFLMQKECRTEDEIFLQANPQIQDLRNELNDFGDTAAALASCDLLISVDTSVAHLAGALGKPLWLLLPFVPDWRWLLDRNDSPWYPTAKLYRQTQSGDWGSVMARVSTDLDALMAHTAASK